jgi:hypothetical protein
MSLENQQLDARNNEFQGSLDGIGGLVLTDARATGATLGAANAELLMDIQGKALARFDVRTAAGALTLVFEGTIDGVNYFALPAFAEQQTIGAALVAEQYVASIISATTMNGTYAIGVSGYRRVRARVSAYTSGNITVTARASVADEIIYAREIPSTFHVTATAAANTAATVTLPAAGVGLFHYITHIDITRNATAALAGTATLIHTTTNLPGSPAWSVGNAMLAGGTEKDVVYEPTTPLKSSVANTATTVVCAAAGAAVLGRVNVTYYVGS